MTPDEFIKHLIQTNKDFERLINDKLPRMVGVEAVNFFEESFENEGFTDTSLKKWQEVKRRINPRRPDRAIAKAPILAVTGNLRRSIEFDPEPGQVTITADSTIGAGSNADYASAHNEGTTTAGRNHNVTIPKRQFIGKSKTLDRKILKIIKIEAKKILK